MKRILCLSGGGVRGMSQVMVLKRLEEDFGQPLHKIYDLVIGTSVGAINAAIISTGKMSMHELSVKYPDMIKRVFKRRGLLRIPRYDRDNFFNIWSDIVGGFYFSDSKTKLMITSVDLVTDTNIYYKSWKSYQFNYLLSTIVSRSFAAPLYFGKINDPILQQVYSDGGIGNANLPLNEAKLQADAFGWNSIQIDAIGTLYDDYTPSYNEVANGRWLKHLMNYLDPSNGGLARAQSKNDQIRMMSYMCKYNPSIKFRYWDCGVNKKYIKMDKIKYLRDYERYGILMSKEPIITYN